MVLSHTSPKGLQGYTQDWRSVSWIRPLLHTYMYEASHVYMYVMYIHIYEYIYVITITCHVTEIEWRSTVRILINCHDFLSNKMHSHQNNYTLYLNSQHPRYLIDHYITSIIFLWPYISRISYILIAHKLKYKPYQFITLQIWPETTT